jgi:O-antigen ligase
MMKDTKAEDKNLRLSYFLNWVLAVGGALVILAPSFHSVDYKLASASLTAGLVLALLGLSWLAGNGPEMTMSPFLVALKVYAFVLLLSWVSSPFRSSVHFPLVLVFWLSLAWGMAQLRLKSELVTGWWLATASLISFYAICQRLGFDLVPAFRSAASQQRAMATYGNPNFLAAGLVTFVPLVLAVTWPVWLRAFATVLVGLAMLATGSRAGLLALVMEFAVFCHWWYWGSQQAARKRILGIVLVMAAGGMFLAWVTIPKEAWFRPTLRLEVWKNSLHLWLQRPWLGWGPGSFVLAFQKQASPDLQAKLTTANQFVEHPHNLILSLLDETGFFGLLAFAGLLGVVFWNAVRRPIAAFSLQAAFWLGLIGFLVENFFDKSLALPGLAFFFWSFAGLATDTSKEPAWKSMGSELRRMSGLFLLVLGILGIWGGIRPVWSYFKLRSQIDFLAQGADSQLEAQARQDILSNPKDIEAWQRLGEFLARRGKFKDAGEIYARALNMDRTSVNSAINLGNCLFQQSRFQEAEASYLYAIKINPASVDGHFDLGYCLFYQRRLKEAVEELDKVLKLNPGNAKAEKLKEQILQ